MTPSVDLPQQARALFLGDELPEGFEWVAGLSPRHMRLFAVELNAALAAPSPESLAQLLDSWEATAEMDQAPDVVALVERRRAGPFPALDAWPTPRTR